MENNIVEILKDDREYIEDYLVRSVYNSAAIESNSITVDETRAILLDGILPNFNRRVSVREFNELVNLKKAWSFVINNYDKEITISLMHEVHKLTMENIDEEAGRFKRTANMVGGILTTSPENVSTEILYLIDNLYKGWLPYAETEIDKVQAVVDFHIQYEEIHPYQDGNGRSGRLLMNWLLLQNNIPPFTIRVEDQARYYMFLRTKDRIGLMEYTLSQITNEALLLNRNGQLVYSPEK